jgi:hypothetical protein
MMLIKGFRMLIGSPTASTKAEADRFPQLTYTCLQDSSTRFPEFKAFPKKPCPGGIMVIRPRYKLSVSLKVYASNTVKLTYKG